MIYVSKISEIISVQQQDQSPMIPNKCKEISNNCCKKRFFKNLDIFDILSLFISRKQGGIIKP